MRDKKYREQKQAAVVPRGAATQTLADALSRYMQQLGLKRRAKAAQRLGDLLAKGSGQN